MYAVFYGGGPINASKVIAEVLEFEAAIPLVSLREPEELHAAPLLNSIENRCVQPFFKEHYDDE